MGLVEIGNDTTLYQKHLRWRALIERIVATKSGRAGTDDRDVLLDELYEVLGTVREIERNIRILDTIERDLTTHEAKR